MKLHRALLALLISFDANADTALSDARVLLDGDMALSANRTTDASSPAYDDLLTHVGADVLATRHLTLGGNVGLSWQRTEGHSAWGAGVSLAPRVGWWMPIGDHAALWPNVSAGLGLASEPACVLISATTSSCERTTLESLDVSLFVPVVVTPIPHLFIAIGPTFVRGLWMSGAAASQQSIGLNAMLGAYL